jgi:nuclear pore complex protein Nup62
VSTTTAAAPAAPATTATTTAGASGSTTAPATTSTTTEPAPNLLRGKTLEEIFETWTTELNTEVKDFEKQANEVREWDRILVQNGSQVSEVSPLRTASMRGCG